MKTQTRPAPGWLGRSGLLAVTLVAALLATVLAPINRMEQASAATNPAIVSFGVPSSGATFPPLWSSQELKFYVASGEKLVTDLSMNGENGRVMDFTYRLIDPTGAVKEERRVQSGAGTTQRIVSQTTQTAAASQAGIWTLKMHTTRGDAPTASRMTGSVRVTNASNVAINGRVWTDVLNVRQASNDIRTLTLHYLNEHGAVYEATYHEYNGLDSTFRSDSIGLAYNGDRDGATNVEKENDCQPTYRSLIDYKMIGFNLPMKDRYFKRAEQCGATQYRIFLNGPPSSAIPASAKDGTVAGGTTWARPAYTTPVVSNLSYTVDRTKQNHAAPLSFITNVQGTVRVTVLRKVGTSYATHGSRDYSLSAGNNTVDIFGPGGVPALSRATDIRFDVQMIDVNEIHFSNQDAELRGGLEVTQVVGASPGDKRLYWDDTSTVRWNAGGVDIYNFQMAPGGSQGSLQRCIDGDSGAILWTPCNTPNPYSQNKTTGGTNGTVSSSTTHGWAWGGPGSGNAINSWGNVRIIDDWARMNVVSPVESLLQAGVPLQASVSLDMQARGVLPAGLPGTGTGMPGGSAAAADGGFSASASTNPLTFQVGQKVYYVYRVTNTGDYVLNNVRIEDALATGRLSPPQPVNLNGLAPGESVEFYTEAGFNAAAADVPSRTNTAQVLATASNGVNVSASDTETFFTEPAAEIKLEKTADKTGPLKVGDQVTYSFKITNETSLNRNLVINDAMLAAAGINVPAPGSIPRNGGTVTVTAPPYTVTLADLQAGEVSNTAQAVAPINPKTSPASNRSTVTIPVVGEPGLAITKSSDAEGSVRVGNQITYSFVVQNTGNVPVTDINVRDQMLTDAGIITSPSNFTLTPGQSVTVTATSPYEVQSNDFLATKIRNTATVTGKYNGQTVTSNASVLEVPVVGSPALEVEVGRTTTGPVEANQRVTFTFQVTNVGNVPLTNINVISSTLQNAGIGVNASNFTLQPGATRLVTANSGVLVTAAHVAAGEIVGYGRASGMWGSTAIATDDSELSVPAVGTPALGVTLTRSPTTSVAVGDQVTYTMVVSNTGTVDLATVTPARVSGASIGNWSLANFALNKGQSRTVTATYTVTATDLANGSVGLTANATGATADGRTATSANAVVSNTVWGSPGVTVSLTRSPSGAVEVDDTITYTMRVTNSGTIDLATVTPARVSGITPSAWSATGFALAKGSYRDVTATYKVTAADLANGSVSFGANATGTTSSANGSRSATSANASVTNTVQGTPALAVTLTQSPTGNVKVGDTITYTLKVENAGTAPLTGVTPARTGGVSPSAWSETNFALAVGASKTVTATYTVTSANLTAGTASLTANATGTGSGRTVTAPSKSVSNAVISSPALTATLTQSPTGNVRVGDTVTYSMTVKNTGNMNTVVVPERVNGVNISAWSETGFTLAPNASRTVTATYTVTLADLAQASVALSARASGTATDGQTATSNQPSVSNVVKGTPGLTASLTRSPTSSVKVGNTITYTLKVTNTGNISTTVTPKRMTGASITWSPASFTLAPGGSQDVTATYTVTETDLANGSVALSARAEGVTSDNQTVNSTQPSVTNAVLGTPVLGASLTRTPTGAVEVGQQITYKLIVSNTGNIGMSSVVPERVSGVSVTWSDTGFALAKGTSKEITATYTVTSADLAAGSVAMSVRAKGTTTDSQSVNSANASVTNTVQGTPALTVLKKASASGPVEVGDQITYTFTVTNTGTAPLTNVRVVDPMVTGLNPQGFNLAVGASQTVTASPYTVTAADLDRGTVPNTAHALGTGSGRTVQSPDSSVTTPVRGTPGLKVVKTANTAGPVQVGDKISYSFVVTNTGTIALTGVKVVDPMLTGFSPATFNLAVGASQTVTASQYTVTTANLDALKVVNTAHATGTTTDSRPVTAPTSTVTVPVTGSPAMTITKTASTAGPVEVGGKITYTFVVKNTGNVPLTNVSVVDTKLSGAGVAVSPATVATLAPNASQTFTSGAYTVTAADLAAKKVDNSANATGKYGTATVNSPSASTSTPVAGSPGMVLVKKTNVTGPVSYNGKITYSFEVTNTGNVALTNVKVADPMLTGKGITITPASASLAVGGKATFTAGAYTVSEADAIARSIQNAATATASWSGGTPVSDTDTVTTPVNELTHTLKLLKRSTDGTQLSGATFRLSLPNGTTVTEVTSSNGTYTFTGLKHQQEYLITEVKAPAGHNLLPKPVKVRTTVGGVVLVDGADALVAKDGSDPWQLLVNNTKPMRLPMTGGDGLGGGGLAVALLLLLAAAWTLNTRRKAA